MRAIRFADLVNGQDVRMVERGSRFRLAFETSQAIRTLSEVAGQYFERDLAFESDVLGQEDFSHTAPAKRADDLVRPDAASDRRLIEIISGQPRVFRKDWRLNEIAFSLVSGEQSFGLFTQPRVVAAHLRQMDCPRLSLKLQRLVEQSVQFFPAFWCHDRLAATMCRRLSNLRRPQS